MSSCINTHIRNLDIYHSLKIMWTSDNFAAMFFVISAAPLILCAWCISKWQKLRVHAGHPIVVEDALEMRVFRGRRGWKREAPEDWGWCGWWSQWSLPALTPQPYGPALGRVHVMEGAWQTLGLKPITWHGRQTNCLRCRLCPEMFFLQSHSPY